MKMQVVFLALLLLTAIDGELIGRQLQVPNVLPPLSSSSTPAASLSTLLRDNQINSASFLEVLKTEDYSGLAARAEKTDIKSILEDGRKYSVGKFGTGTDAKIAQKRKESLPKLEGNDVDLMMELMKKNGLPDFTKISPKDVDWNDIAKKITNIRTEQNKLKQNSLIRSQPVKRRVLKLFPLSDKAKGWVVLAIVVLVIIISI